jgi:ATP-dependent Clp protease ATP-binding subunit ClpA
METIKRAFSPEFRNRLDAIVQFKPLDAATILHVVDKFLTQLEVQLETKRVALTVSDEARAWLAERGYDPQMGARPMGRVIQEQIKRPLADEILFGRLTEGGRVRVEVQDERLTLEVDSRVAAV